MTGKNKIYIIGSTKTETAVRSIPINTSAIARIAPSRGQTGSGEAKLWGGIWKDNGLVFALPGGLIVSLNGMSDKFITIVKKSGIDRRTFHDMRHTFASICISQKVNIKALSQYLGHADISITLDPYGHLLPGDKEEIANTIEAFLAGI